MSEECQQCGHSNEPGATRCQWCGAPLPPPKAHRLLPISLERDGFDESEPPSERTEPDEPPSTRRWDRIGVVVVVVIVVVAAIAVYEWSNLAALIEHKPSQTSTPVEVTFVEVSSPDNACGLQGAVAEGFSTPGYATHNVSWYVPIGSGGVPCSVQNVSSDTPGFSLSANVPLHVTSLETPLIVEIRAPASYDGILSITFQ